MSTLKVDQLEAATASTITVPSGQTLDISSATLTPPATMPASSAANLTSIPAANITGTIAAVSGANLTALNATQLTSGAMPAARMPAGSIVQVAQTVQTATYSTTADAWNNITGMDVDITPSDSNNKMIVTYTINCASNAGQRFGVRLYRDSTTVLYAASTGDRQASTSIGKSTQSTESEHHTITYIDSPATDVQVTYFLKCWTEGTGTFYLNRNESDSNQDDYYRGVSTITVMELQV